MQHALRTDDLYAPIEQGRALPSKCTLETGLHSGLRIETSVPPTPGLLEALERLHDVKGLEAGWDSYTSKATDSSVFRPALELVIDAVQRCKVPRITGNGTGGVILLWEDVSRELEVDIDPSGSVTAYYADEATGEQVDPSEPVTLGEAKSLLWKFCAD